MALDSVKHSQSPNLFRRSDLTQNLDSIHIAINASAPLASPMADLASSLKTASMQMSKEEFDQQILPECLAHPSHPLLLEDPYTNRGYTKPRGFAGDAGLMDYFHGLRGLTPTDTSLGGAIFSLNMRYPSCDAVRFRRAYFAGQIDRVAERNPQKGQILSVACGHLREASFSRALNNNQIDKFTALDQDIKALETIDRDYGTLNLDITPGSILHLIAGRQKFSDLDLVYAAGLYDYLDDKIAKKLTKHLANMLLPGGRLILPNFLPTIPERGYMQGIMNWSLTYRSEQDMSKLCADLTPDLFNWHTFTDPKDCIVYLVIDKVDKDTKVKKNNTFTDVEIATKRPEGQSLKRQPITAAISILKLTQNIHDTEHAVKVFDALESHQTERNFQRYIATKEGRDLIKKGMDLEDILSDHTYLKSLPQHSLGNRYVTFLNQYGLSTEGLITAQKKADVHSLHLEPQRRLFISNGFQLHDVFHVLMGYDTDPMGEAGVLAFTAGQLGLKSIHKLALALACKEKFFFPRMPVFKVVQEGLISGRCANWCNLEDWESLLPLPLKDVQSQLNIQLPSLYLAGADIYQRRNGLYATG